LLKKVKNKKQIKTAGKIEIQGRSLMHREKPERRGNNGIFSAKKHAT